MSAKINPLAAWVVAQPVAKEAKTASGLYLTESAKEKPVMAKVVSAGKEVKSVKAGDQILYKEYSTTEIKLDGEEFILVKEEDILATVK